MLQTRVFEKLSACLWNFLYHIVPFVQFLFFNSGRGFPLDCTFNCVIRLENTVPWSRGTADIRKWLVLSEDAVCFIVYEKWVPLYFRAHASPWKWTWSLKVLEFDVLKHRAWTKKQVQPFLVSYQTDSPMNHSCILTCSLLRSFMEHFVKSALLKCWMLTEPV